MIPLEHPRNLKAKHGFYIFESKTYTFNFKEGPAYYNNNKCNEHGGDLAYFSIYFEQKYSFQNQEDTMIGSPYNKAPHGTMPKAGDQKYNT